MVVQLDSGETVKVKLSRGTEKRVKSLLKSNERASGEELRRIINAAQNTQTDNDCRKSSKKAATCRRSRCVCNA